MRRSTSPIVAAEFPGGDQSASQPYEGACARQSGIGPGYRLPPDSSLGRAAKSAGSSPSTAVCSSHSRDRRRRLNSAATKRSTPGISGRTSSLPSAVPTASPIPSAATLRAERIGAAEGGWREAYPVGRTRDSIGGADSSGDTRHAPSLTMSTTPTMPPANAARRMTGSSNTAGFDLSQPIALSFDTCGVGLGRTCRHRNGIPQN